MAKKSHVKHQKLTEWFATSICGNDILSSTLYVSGIAILFAGVYAPIVLLLIVLVLYFYKAVYTEVVEALPVNGGAYNCLLNGTSKTVAAIAGVMTTLSYVATAVLSAKIGVEYLHTILPGFSVILGTVGLLGFFALLVIFGIKDSAKVAFGIFILHVFTLVLFIIFGVWAYLQGHSFFAFNLAHTAEIIQKQGGFLSAFYLAFSASLLGVSGFESSANFVEEQEKGVFRKTLRNMLIAVGIFNPLIAFVVLSSLPIDAIVAAKDFLLADAARSIGGTLLHSIVAIDAFLVLSGAVLTSYVGVSGLLNRMSGDGCIPAFLGKANKKGSFPRIIVTFFLLCSSILLLTKGNLLSLAGVYTISFLGVMSLFALGNLTLRKNRPDLKRTYHAPIAFVFAAFLATFLGVLGNIRIDAQNLTFFEFYFVPAIVIVFAVIYHDQIIKFALHLSGPFPKAHRYILRHFQNLIDGKFVVFIHHPEKLYSILSYIDKNEFGRNVILVHCKNRKGTYDPDWNEIKKAIPHLRKTGVLSHLNIEPHFVDHEFGPKAIEVAARDLKVEKNRILIGSIHESHDFDYDELGGARIIH